jgi:two-component system, cell cycle response regulator
MPKKRADQRRPAETIRFAADEAPDYSRASRRFAALLVVQGAEADLNSQVVCDKPITIGRDDEVELPLRDGSISRRHCTVEREEETGRYLLKDLGSTNGTRVNGTRVSDPMPLSEGDKIFLGASVVKFSYVDGFDVEYHAKLEEWVATDALTGLLNLRRFEAAFHFAVQRARGEGEPLAVMVMDMDGLKLINDTHGHEMGGFTIIEAAKLIRRFLEGKGETCRFGGDEFVSFLVGHDKASAVKVAESVVAGVKEHVFEKNGVTLKPTISVGVSMHPEDGDTPEELFRAADRALYRAKAAGRNQVAS